jgi:hypothetical protein
MFQDNRLWWFVILKQAQDDDMTNIYRKNLCVSADLCASMPLRETKNRLVSRKGAKIFNRAG